MKISHSQVKCFRRCQKQWWFKYIRDLSSRQSSRALRFGSLTHDMLQEHYNGNNPFVALEKIADKDQDYQQDEPGVREIYAAVEGNFDEYLHYYGEEDWTTLSVEEYFEHKFRIGRKWFTLRGYFDLVVEDGWGRWLVEHKTGKMDTAEGARFWDMQSMIYHWVYSQLHPDTPLMGTIWNYVTSSALLPPKILAKGGLSRAERQRTTWRLYEEAIHENGLDPDLYIDMQERLEAKMPTYFSRTTLPVDEDAQRELMADFFEVCQQMRKAQLNLSHRYLRNMDKHCAWCDYEPLCQLELLTGDFEDAIDPDYSSRKDAKKVRREKDAVKSQQD